MRVKVKLLCAVMVLLVCMSLLLSVVPRIHVKCDDNNNQRPNYLFQTYHDRSVIPSKVGSNMRTYTGSFRRYVYDDNDIITFLLKHFGIEAVHKFHSLKEGAHKADFWRYCVLYIYGGIYMDIKTELIEDLNSTFPDKKMLYCVLSKAKNHIYNGVIATPPRNIIMMEMINYIMTTSSDIINRNYFSIVTKHYEVIKKYLAHDFQIGLNNVTNKCKENIYILEEHCTSKACDCNNKLDRYGLCCYIYDKGIKKIKVRYSDFPWGTNLHKATTK